MRLSPFDQPGTFRKGNLHTHSTRSDGGLEPGEVARRYREAGYDFIALTDHFLAAYGYPITDTRAFRSEDFTTLIGAELHTDTTEFGDMWHLLAVGLPDDFAPPEENESAAALARRARDTGAYVAAAHPAWYGITERDLAALGPVDAIEVFNGVAVDHNGHCDSWELTDIVLGRGHGTLVCATDDFHGTEGRNDFARGWVQVKSETLEPGALLAALKLGHYYSSTGPEIHDLERVGDRLRLTCSPADRVFLTGKGPRAIALPGHGGTEFEFDLGRFRSPYARVTVRAADGSFAWTNPFAPGNSPDQPGNGTAPTE